MKSLRFRHPGNGLQYQKMAYRLAVVDGLSHAAIGRRLGISEVYARKLVVRHGRSLGHAHLWSRLSARASLVVLRQFGPRFPVRPETIRAAIRNDSRWLFRRQNCGRQTVQEIVTWSGARLVRPPRSRTRRCACGCGQLTQIARLTNTQRGYVRGHAQQYLPGHNRYHGMVGRASLKKRFVRE